MATPKVAVELSAVDRYSAAFGQFTGGLDRIESKVGMLDTAFSRLPFFGTALVGGLGGGAISAAIKGTIDDFDSLAKAAQKVGTSVESLSALRYAGELSGISFDSISTGLKKLSVNAADAAKGTGDAKDAFRALGVSVTDAAGALKSPEALLGEIADKFAGFEDGATKTALAVKLFGRAGADLIPMLNGGARGLAEMRGEAEAFGIIIGGDAAKAAERFNDNLTRMGQAINALKISLASGVVDKLVKLTDAWVAAKQAGFSGFEAITGIGVRGLNESISDAYANATTRIEELQTARGAVVAEQTKLLERGDKGLAAALDGKLSDLDKRIAFYRGLIKRSGGLEGDGMLSPVAPGAAPKFDAEKSAKAGKQGLSDLERFLAKVQTERMAEYEKFSREVTSDDLDQQAVTRAKEAIKAAEERSKRLQNLYGQTAQGKHEALVGNLQFIDSLKAAGDITELQAKAITDYLFAVKEAGQDAFGGIAQSIKDMGNKAADTFADMLVDGKASFSGMVSSWLKDLARLEARKALDPLTSAAGSFVDKALGSLFGGSTLGSLPAPSLAGNGYGGFATGGSFTVGGAGGTDSKLVAFRATPGEKVTIQTPAQQGNTGGGSSMVFNIDARGADMGVAARIEDGVRRAVSMSVQAVAAQADRGGSYARALGRRR